MTKKISKLKVARDEVELIIEKVNEKISELGNYTGPLSDYLNTINNLFSKIRNMPVEKIYQYEETQKICSNWKEQVKEIEKDYKNTSIKIQGGGAIGVTAGVSIAALGPSVAMGIATTFGVASTGTAISTLSGAAATKAALAWLGGGALAAKGGGIAAGKLLLGLAGPIGWSIAGIAIVGTGFLFVNNKSNQNRVENIITMILEKEIKRYNLAITEINERIDSMIRNIKELNYAIEQIKTFGTDYNIMTEEQQYNLGTFLNLTTTSSCLLTNNILGLQPVYTENDYEKFIIAKNYISENKNVIIYFANLLHNIMLDKKDIKLLWKAYKNDKKMLEILGINKKNFNLSLLEKSIEALKFKKK